MPIADLDAPTGTIVRCVRVLEQLAENFGPVAVSKLAAQLGLAPSTTHRILAQLRKEGLVSHSVATATYRPGPGLIRIAALIMGSTPFRDAYINALLALNETTGETSFLAVYLPASGKMRLAHVVPSRHPIQYVMPQNEACSLLFGASGRGIAAYIPDETLRQIYEAEAEGEMKPLPKFEELREALAEIRRAGYAVSSGQRVSGAHAISAPVFAQGHVIMGALGVSMPVFRADDHKDKAIIVQVKAEAEQLSMLLGDVGDT